MNNFTNFNENYMAVKGYERVTNEITKCVSNVMENYLKIGVLLLRMREEKYYEIAGYASLDEYANTEFNFSKTLVNNVINVALRFAKRDDNNNYLTVLDDKYSEFSFSQLVELLPVKKIDVDEIKPSMSIKEIRIQKARSKISDEIKDFNDSVKNNLLKVIDEKISKRDKKIPWKLNSEFDEDGYATFNVIFNKDLGFKCQCYHSDEGNSVYYSSSNSAWWIGNHGTTDCNEMIDLMLADYDEYSKRKLEKKAEKNEKAVEAENLEKEYQNKCSIYENPVFIGSNLSVEFKNRNIFRNLLMENVLEFFKFFPKWKENDHCFSIKCSVEKVMGFLRIKLDEVRFSFDDKNCLTFSLVNDYYRPYPTVAESFSQLVIKMNNHQVKFSDFYMYGFIGSLQKYLDKKIVDSYFGFDKKKDSDVSKS